jgi:hypothetical protein
MITTVYRYTYKAAASSEDDLRKDTMVKVTKICHVVEIVRFD